MSLKKIQKDFANIENEIGDIMFNLTCLFNSHNFDMYEIWKKRMDKAYDRNKDRFEKDLKYKK